VDGPLQGSKDRQALASKGFSKQKMNDLKPLISIEAIQGKSPDLTAYYAPLGDYIGGVFGTVVGAITLIFVFQTWWNDTYKGRREKIFQCVFELLQAHDKLSKGLDRLHYKPEIDPFGGVLHEFYQIYGLTQGVANGDICLSIKDKISIAYVYTYYGPCSEALELSKAYWGESLAKAFHHAVQIKRQNDQGKGFRKDYLAGHQQELSHYFRNLYTLYRYIKESGLKNADKRLLARIARSRISNYEQALLMLNTISPLGKAWTDSGLIREYEPFSNVPKHFLTFDKDFNPSTFFPMCTTSGKITILPNRVGLLYSSVMHGLFWKEKWPDLDFRNDFCGLFHVNERIQAASRVVKPPSTLC
jgi:hypothetical protein